MAPHDCATTFAGGSVVAVFIDFGAAPFACLFYVAAFTVRGDALLAASSQRCIPKVLVADSVRFQGGCSEEHACRVNGGVGRYALLSRRCA